VSRSHHATPGHGGAWNGKREGTFTGGKNTRHGGMRSVGGAGSSPEAVARREEPRGLCVERAAVEAEKED